MKHKILLLDTDVIIDYLKNNSLAVKFLEQLTHPLLLSVITVAELYAGVRGSDEQRVIEKFLEAFEIVPLDHSIACMGGLLKKEYNKSHGTGLADALIAATAMQRHAELVTLNIRHYPMLEPYKPYDKKTK